MKKNYLFAVALGAAVLTGCSQDEQLGMMQENRSGFTGTLELPDSRTTLGEDNKVNWVEGVDEVSIFEMDDQNTQYKVKSVSNGVAQFEFVDYIEKENPVSFDDYYSVYPYDDANSISAKGVISATVPSKIENYSGKDDAISQALMVAKSKTTDLKYSNAQGILLLRLNAQKPTNYGAIKSIKLTSAKYKLAGTATMSWADDIEKPEAKIGDDGTSELTIELASALQAELPKSASGEYAEYYIPVVPTVFEKNDDETGDVTMSITFEKGNYEKNIGIEFAVGRNKIKPLKHTVGSKDFTGEIEQVVYRVTSDEELADMNGKSGIALLNAENLCGSDDIEFTGAFEVEGKVTLDMNNHTLISGTVDDYGIRVTGSGNEIILDNVNLDSKGGGIGAANGAQVTFNSGGVAVNTKNTSGRYNFYVVGEGTVATINGGEFSFSSTLNQKRAYIYCGEGATVYVKGGTFGAASKRDGYTSGILGDGKVIITGGIFGFNPKQWVAEGYQVIQDEQRWSVVSNEVTVVNSADDLATAVAAGSTNFYLKSGEYDVKDCGGKTLTISGTKETVLKLMNEGEDGCDYGFGTAGTGVGNVTFNGLTINTTSNTGNYKGYAYMKGTFIDCDFVGPYSLNNANDFVFNKCTFDFKDGYFWTWAANNVTFDGCTFNGNSKAILAHGWASTVITIKDCTFAATEKGYANGGKDWTAAVEIDPAGTNVYTINFEGNNTKNENYIGWTRIKDGSTGHTFTGLN